ncbi:MAG: hypothetical protein OM95_04900 [Bdellovibrio sp. ArHS]|uniref:hypothetical protein n=1 Tax=Bdellovibrio sp. ArHS TaxID=1569284 RepID=UPI00058356A2|nr:hypothetical protein [Bdellovibrio sp. ArHS]KHD89162.1 MAG: hypothetical protein OM95_04900 [Bdellovibrio sp. ArHS]
MKKGYFKTAIILFAAVTQLTGCMEAALMKGVTDAASGKTGGQKEPAVTSPDDSNSSNDSAALPDSGVSAGAFSIEKEAQKYKDRYELTDTFAKLTDNRGDGVEELWGTRNFRVVLHGVMYRGGANNKYLNPSRNNVNPLPTVGLNNLCKEDFGASVYLYSENYSTAPKSVTCQNTSHQTHTLQYKQYAAAGENEAILQMVYNRIKGKLNGPIYAHCWNGWHSSGLIAGMALKQFCGWSNDKVDAYWVKNTDGNSSGFTTIRNRLKAFKPYVKFSITAAERAAICPAN